MSAVAKEQPSQLEVLERIRYQAPFKSFDPRQYDAWYTKHLFPVRLLEAVGMENICNFLLNQISPKDISIMLGISQHIMMRWIDASAERRADWEWALSHEADNLMYEARDKLEAAYVPPDKALDKAEKQANHNRIMAKGFGQKRWGQRVDAAGMPLGATVTYNFNIALLPGQQEKLIRERERVIEHKGELNPPVSFNFENYLGSGTNVVDLTLGLGKKEEMSYEEAQAQESAEEIRQEQEG
jgi:hypothetical protein